MPLQLSGPISIADIAAEFGGAAPHSLSEYYRGGVNVPDTAANAGIPTSGAIKLSDFYGGDNTEGIVSITSSSASDSNPGLFTRAGWTFNPDGTISAEGDTIDAPGGLTWFTGAPSANIGAGYQIRRTDAGNYEDNEANQNVWVTLDVPREWAKFAAGAASPTNEGENLAIEIREGTSGAAEDSAIFSISISN